MKKLWTCYLFLKTTSIFAGLATTSLQEIDEFHLGPQEVYLIRHGESFFNVHKVNGMHVTSGKSEKLPLTEKGEQQAIALGVELAKKIPLGTEIVICSSTALRAQKTADLLLHELSRFYQCERGQSYEGLLELSQGIFEGLPKDAKYMDEVNKWAALSAADKWVTPKVSTGESFREVSQRAFLALDKIVNEYKGKMIFVVTHNVTMISLTYLGCGYTPFTLSQIPGSKLPLLEYKNCDLLQISIEKPADLLHIKFAN
ncbi:MAG: histidine phosphatase family protein [Verrucomicrobia bacterium]|nr:histidine phosphatase family protein [Verrucomicrobiota bacterium]